jgi:tripartite-type tricarboxylate transporter receptor subunit TctC
VRTKYSLLIIVAAIVFSPVIFPVPGFSQAPFYQGKTLKIVNNDPGGVVSLRVKTVSKYLSKYIPGSPTIIVEIIEGGGGRRAANQVFQNAKPDGLTIGALSSSIVGLQVMRQTGVMYDIDKFIHLGTPIRAACWASRI